MTVSVVEYLGINAESSVGIAPIKIRKDKNQSAELKPFLPCPFKNSHCDKAKRGDKPVCSVRDHATGKIWIVCEHRLCATTPKKSPLNDYQKNVLHEVAKYIFNEEIPFADILVKREVSIKVTEKSKYSADYVMWRKNPNNVNPTKSDKPVVLEMQGGGETVNTGPLSEHITIWEDTNRIDNEFLRKPINSVNILPTNAWRRQQEQFLIKGNVALMTGGKIVFCVGRLLYDYLMQRFINNIPRDLRETNWTLAILAFDELKDKNELEYNEIKFGIENESVIFTNYNSFVQVLTNQAKPSDSLFSGDFMDLDGNKYTI